MDGYLVGEGELGRPTEIHLGLQHSLLFRLNILSMSTCECDLEKTAGSDRTRDATRNTDEGYMLGMRATGV